MKNSIIEINGRKAVISFSSDIQMFRGEFTGLAGGADFYADNLEGLYKSKVQPAEPSADFYADNLEGLYKEGAISLKVYLDMCRENSVKPFK